MTGLCGMCCSCTIVPLSHKPLTGSWEAFASLILYNSGGSLLYLPSCHTTPGASGAPSVSQDLELESPLSIYHDALISALLLRVFPLLIHCYFLVAVNHCTLQSSPHSQVTSLVLYRQLLFSIQA